MNLLLLKLKFQQLVSSKIVYRYRFFKPYIDLTLGKCKISHHGPFNSLIIYMPGIVLPVVPMVIIQRWPINYVSQDQTVLPCQSQKYKHHSG